jgi:peptide deformylase
MALLKVRTYPDPILKLKAAPLMEFGEKEQRLFDDMIETMYVEDGVGIAAPQIGVSKRIFIACPTMKKGEEHVMVNVEILESSGREMGVEGCLSLPGVSGEVPRAKKLKFRYQDRHGKPHEMEVKDFFARVIQHEMDHLDGILLIDRVSFNKRQEILSQYQLL